MIWKHLLLTVFFVYPGFEWDRCVVTAHTAERTHCAPWLAEFSTLLAGTAKAKWQGSCGTWKREQQRGGETAPHHTSHKNWLRKTPWLQQPRADQASCAHTCTHLSHLQSSWLSFASLNHRLLHKAAFMLLTILVSFHFRRDQSS